MGSLKGFYSGLLITCGGFSLLFLRTSASLLPLGAGFFERDVDLRLLLDVTYLSGLTGSKSRGEECMLLSRISI